MVLSGNTKFCEYPLITVSQFWRCVILHFKIQWHLRWLQQSVRWYLDWRGTPKWSSLDRALTISTLGSTLQKFGIGAIVQSSRCRRHEGKLYGLRGACNTSLIAVLNGKVSAGQLSELLNDYLSPSGIMEAYLENSHWDCDDLMQLKVVSSVAPGKEEALSQARKLALFIVRNPG